VHLIRRAGSYSRAGFVGYIELDSLGVSPRRYTVGLRASNDSGTENFQMPLFQRLRDYIPETMCHILRLRYSLKGNNITHIVGIGSGSRVLGCWLGHSPRYSYYES
jgi:hypothetical protein